MLKYFSLFIGRLLKLNHFHYESTINFIHVTNHGFISQVIRIVLPWYKSHRKIRHVFLPSKPNSLRLITQVIQTLVLFKGNS